MLARACLWLGCVSAETEMQSFKGPLCWQETKHATRCGSRGELFRGRSDGGQILYICIRVQVQMQVLLLLFARLQPLSLFLAPVESVRQPRAPATGEQCCARETPPQILSDVDGAGLKNKLSQSVFCQSCLLLSDCNHKPGANRSLLVSRPSRSRCGGKVVFVFVVLELRFLALR
jgi:hypothetical protein